MYNQIDSNKRKSFLLIFLFIAFISFLGWIFGQLTDYGYAGLVLAIIISLLIALFGYYSGDKMALWTAGAKPIQKEANPEIYRLVENLCITAGLPLPKIYLIPDAAPNAFATGRDPQHASLALTVGLIGMMKKEELEGVIAHELSHVKNYDIRLMTLVIVLIGIVSLLSNWLMRSFIWGGGRRSDRDDRGQSGVILMIVGLVLAILSPFIGQLIQLAISRKREFLADADGALLTRYPAGLASALEKISAYARPMKSANNATAHLYISNPFGASKRNFAKYFSTHPPVEERIKALRAMIR